MNKRHSHGVYSHSTGNPSEKHRIHFLRIFTFIGDVHHEQRCELICIHTWKPWTTNCLTRQTAYWSLSLLVNPLPVSGKPRPWNVPGVARRGTNDASNLRWRTWGTAISYWVFSPPSHQVGYSPQQVSPTCCFIEYRCITSLSEPIGGWQDHP